MRLAGVELLLGHEQPLDDAGDVAQVELVEELARGRTEFGLDEDLLEDAVERFDAALGHGLDLLVELLEVVDEDASEDAGDGVVGRLGDGERGEEALHAVGDEAGAHLRVEGGADEEVLELDELLEVLEVLGVFVVDDLLEQLDGALGAVVVGEGHVEVVNEVDDFAEGVFGPVLDGVLFVHLAHDEVEELAGEDVLVEGGGDRADFVVLLALLGDPVDEVLDEGGFAGAGAADDADGAVG